MCGTAAPTWLSSTPAAPQAGSAPKADIYIFKDADIEPKHALLHNRGGRFEIEDCGTKHGTYVNGVLGAILAAEVPTA